LLNPYVKSGQDKAPSLPPTTLGMSVAHVEPKIVYPNREKMEADFEVTQ